MNALIPALRGNRIFRFPELTMFDRLFDSLNVPDTFKDDSAWLPSIDVSETKEAIIIRAEVPGISKDDIDVTVADGTLTLKGEKKHEHEEKEENFHLVESSHGSFSRTFRLPDEIDTENVNAVYTDGVLKITVPKTEKEEPKKITVA